MISKEEMKLRRDKVIKNWEINKDKGRFITELAKECNVTPETYRKYLREVGYDPKGVIYKYKCDRSFFKVIDTERKAYWLGFIYADGNVSIQEGNAYILSITLGEKDKHHLEKFQQDIGTNIKIYPKKAINPYTNLEVLTYRIDISSKELCMDLIDKGCTPCKSLTKKFPKGVPNNLMNHFLRGYFDGNGSLVFRKSNINYDINITSSIQFLNNLMDYLKSTLNITPTKIYLPKLRINDGWGTWYKRGREAKIVLDYLYQDSTIYLDRKYLRYKDLSTINSAKSVKAKS